MLKVSNLNVEYWTDRGKLRAIDDLSLTVAPGEIVGLAGNRVAEKYVDPGDYADLAAAGRHHTRRGAAGRCERPGGVCQ